MGEIRHTSVLYADAKPNQLVANLRPTPNETIFTYKSLSTVLDSLSTFIMLMLVNPSFPLRVWFSLSLSYGSGSSSSTIGPLKWKYQLRLFILIKRLTSGRINPWRQWVSYLGSEPASSISWLGNQQNWKLW